MGRKPREDGRNPRTVANNNTNKKLYDRLSVNVIKGNKELVQDYAKSIGESYNSLINKLLAREIEGFVPTDKNPFTKPKD